MAIRLHLTTELPDDYRALFWHEFLASRGRGISLATHFPWLLDPQRAVLFVTLRDGERLLGGLTLRPHSPALMALGLVCVEASSRGRGLSRILLEAALAEVDRRGHDATLLWTRQPAVYSGLGFFAHDDSCRLAIDGWAGDTSGRVHVAPWPDDDEHAIPPRGLPPFAHAAQRVRHPSNGADIIVLQDALGLQVVEQRGEPGLALATLRAWAPERWRLHATSTEAPLVRTLLAAGRATPGLSVALTPDALQMWRPHPDRAGRLTPPPAWPLLDRL